MSGKMPVSWGAGIFLLSFLYWSLGIQSLG